MLMRRCFLTKKIFFKENVITKCFSSDQNIPPGLKKTSPQTLGHIRNIDAKPDLGAVKQPSYVLTDIFDVDVSSKKKPLNDKDAENQLNEPTLMTGYSDQGFEINHISCYGSIILFPRTFALWNVQRPKEITLESLQLVSMYTPRICEFLFLFFQ